MATRHGAADKRRAEALAAYLEPAFRALDGDARPPEDPDRLHRWLLDEWHARPADVESLYDLYAQSTRQPPHRSEQPPGRLQRVGGWFLWHIWNAPAVVFLVATGFAVWGYVFFRGHPDWQAPVAQGFIVLLLTLLPGFLYLRFIRFRLGPLSAEYVYNLHRLGVDQPAYLPEPPRTSAAWTRWYESGGPGFRNYPNIYAMKFESQYGRWPTSGSEEHKESIGRLMSVYLCLATLGVGWAFAVWTAPNAEALPRLIDALRFGFFGAYFFLLSLLIRRYFQNDLRPGAYLSGVVRIATVLLLVVGVDQLFDLRGVPPEHPDALENMVAFVVGVFPSVGMQLLRRGVGKITGRFRGGIEPPFPLSQLDGMDIWSESRLLEVGIEDVQHLATANLVDVSLGARIPTQRIVDWVDQALLLLRTGLPRIDNLREPTTYAELRALSVRSSTDLLELVTTLKLDLTPTASETWPDRNSPVAPLAATQAASAQSVAVPSLTRLATVPLLTRIALAATTLEHEPNLQLLRNWQRTAPEDGA